MRLKRAATIVVTAGMAVAVTMGAGCRPKVVSTPTGGLPSVVVQTVREEDSTLRYSITASYPQLRSTASPAVLEKVNKAIMDMVLPDIAGLKQNAADDTAWAAKNPSDAAQLPERRVRNPLPDDRACQCADPIRDILRRCGAWHVVHACPQCEAGRRE
ncbi:MAG: hypothetical protein NTZ77_03190 [Caldiserica bacterium]|nr:hypothetical protein [Caldisericota bacterium]